VGDQFHSVVLNNRLYASRESDPFNFVSFIVYVNCCRYGSAGVLATGMGIWGASSSPLRMYCRASVGNGEGVRPLR